MKKPPLAVIVLALVAPVTLVACSLAAGMELVQTSFVAHFLDRLYVDLTTPGGSLGASYPGHGELTDVDGAVIGRFDVHSVTTRIEDNLETRFITAQYTFGDGSDSFVIEGAQEFDADGLQAALDDALHYAVVGGTGKYMGANGECLVKRNEKDYRVECSFYVFGE